MTETCTIAMSSTPRRRRNTSEDDGWGFFEDFESPILFDSAGTSAANSMLQRAFRVPPPKSEIPVYILEESISSQNLWHETAGRRPRQPSDERKYFERIMEQNFKESEVNYSRSSSIDSNDCCHHSKKMKSEMVVLYRGVSPFGTAVSKAFISDTIPSITLQLSHFRIVRHGPSVYAEFLVVVKLGNVTYGVWKRHTDFKVLAHEIERKQKHLFKNSLLSWQCLIHRQRWFRCLDKDYLALKCFLLERFMHDLLFETRQPELIIEFLGIV